MNNPETPAERLRNHYEELPSEDLETTRARIYDDYKYARMELGIIDYVIEQRRKDE